MLDSCLRAMARQLGGLQRLSRPLLIAVAVLAAMSFPRTTAAQVLPNTAVRCVTLEIYVRGSEVRSQQALGVAKPFVDRRDGVSLRVYDLEKEDALERLRAIGRYFKIDEPSVPFVYGCNQKIMGFADDATYRRRLEALLRMTVYVRAGCPRCQRAKDYLPGFARRYPGVDVHVVDIVSNYEARDRLQQLAWHYGIGGTSVPTFHFCDQLLVGFDDMASTAARLEQAWAKWTHACPARSSDSNGRRSARVPVERYRVFASAGSLAGQPRTLLAALLAGSIAKDGSSSTPPTESETTESEPAPLPVPPAGDSQLPVPEGPDGKSSGERVESVNLPLFGRLSVQEIGLPLFTLAIGLVDGFNPCAMWVLLFLLSVLVNLHSRAKILAVAGTFVVISGLAYFAFMAAWLNVFLLVGLVRPIQIVLALLAIFIGTVHVKDFFAFRRGISLSIPESAKPGIYRRVHSIVTAEHLWGALIGASILAVLVNVIELLCTAGLPALYTQILTLHELPTWANYLYLGLYNLAYMADDILMVTLVVVTLSHRKMQEVQGRWLKLFSGLVILALGIVLLLRPQWLV